jgi:hypothetical protein
MNNGIVSKEIERILTEMWGGAALTAKALGALLEQHPELDYADVYKKQRDELLEMVNWKW